MMEESIRRVFSGSPYEQRYGFCRALRRGRRIEVAGTAPIPPAGEELAPDARGQMLRCGEILSRALAELGAGLEHVVRTRMFITDPADADEIGAAHGELFGGAHAPVATMVVTRLLDPRWRIELEAEAELPEDAKGATASAPRGAAVGRAMEDEPMDAADTPEPSFANPAGSAAADAATYVRNLLALLGDREPLENLERTLEELPAAVKGLDEAALRRPEKPGKWSVLQVVQHLADSDLVWAYRVRRILADDRPAISGYDQDLWAERLRYADARLEDALEQFAAVRRANLRLLRALSPGEWSRIGIHAERGEESIAHLTKLYAAHDLVHLRQIARIRAAVA